MTTKDFSFGAIVHSQASCFMRRLSQLTRVKIDQGQASVNILYNERKGFFSQYKSFCYAWHRLIDDIFLSIFVWCDIYKIFVAETDVDIIGDILIDIFKMHLNLTRTPITFLENHRHKVGHCGDRRRTELVACGGERGLRPRLYWGDQRSP